MYKVVILAVFSVTAALPINNLPHQNSSSQLLLNITGCPAWYLPSSDDGCTCGSSLGPLVKCHKNQRVSVRVAYCMSYDAASGQLLVGNCPYVKKRKKDHGSYIMQPKNVSKVNAQLCSWANRTGFMCGRCREGLGVSVMTYDNKCLECLGAWKGWALYLFLAIIPTTVFFALVISCHIRGTSGYFNSLICIFQVITFYVDKYPYTIISTLSNSSASRCILYVCITIAGFWNLDFFRHVIPNFCISESLTTLDIIAMDYIVATYPLVLIVATYICIELYDRDFRLFQILWAPFKCILKELSWKIDIRHTLIDAFATFLQLSYSKLVFVSFNLLSYVAPYNSKGEHVYPNVLYYAGEVSYLSRTHLPFFILAMAVFLVLVILPVLLLLFYPTKTFQRCLGFFSGINWHPLHAFADAFNGCYKNGTNGTWDMRYFGSFYLLFRVVFYLMSAISQVQSALIVTFVPLLASLMFGIFKPYKNNFFNILDATMFTLLELNQIWAVYETYAFKVPPILNILLAPVPFVYLCAIIIYKIVSLCAPSILAKWKTKLYFLSALQTISGQREGLNISLNPARVNVEDDDISTNEPDRLLNPENYQPLAQSGGSHGSSATTSCLELQYSYGSLN